MGEGDNLTNSQVESIKNPGDGRSDPDKQFPKKEYVGISSVNNIARGTRVSNVYIGGSVPDVNLELNNEPSTQYPENQVKQTASGHIIEYDDTNGTSNCAIEQLLEIYDKVIFANGGDRHNENVPEYEKFKDHENVIFRWAVGGLNKMNSSSWILSEWDER